MTIYSSFDQTNLQLSQHVAVLPLPTPDFWTRNQILKSWTAIPRSEAYKSLVGGIAQVTPDANYRGSRFHSSPSSLKVCSVYENDLPIAERLTHNMDRHSWVFPPTLIQLIQKSLPEGMTIDFTKVVPWEQISITSEFDPEYPYGPGKKIFSFYVMPTFYHITGFGKRGASFHCYVPTMLLRPIDPFSILDTHAPSPPIQTQISDGTATL